jgi:hypothetical protein
MNTGAPVRTKASTALLRQFVSPSGGVISVFWKHDDADGDILAPLDGTLSPLALYAMYVCVPCVYVCDVCRCVPPVDLLWSPQQRKLAKTFVHKCMCVAKESNLGMGNCIDLAKQSLAELPFPFNWF